MDIKMIDYIKTTKHLSGKDTAFLGKLQPQIQHYNKPVDKQDLRASKSEKSNSSITSRFYCANLSISVDTIHIEIPKQDFDDLLGKQTTVDSMGEIKYEWGYKNCIKIIQCGNKTKLECSLPKLLRGNNVYCLSYYEILEAIKLIEKALNISLENGIVRRIDLFVNIETDDTPASYFRYLSDKKGLHRRLHKKTTLYYENNNREICFYDKFKEMKKHGTAIPNIFTGKNLMRVEYRIKNVFLKRIFGHLSVKDLFSKKTMMILADNFMDEYSSIFKEKKPTINIDALHSIKIFKNYLLSEGIRFKGGLNEVLEMIDDSKLRNPNIRKEYFSRLKKEVKNISSLGGFAFNEKSIIELDKKFEEGFNKFIESMKTSSIG
jgi:hypothetical protein